MEQAPLQVAIVASTRAFRLGLRSLLSQDPGLAIAAEASTLAGLPAPAQVIVWAPEEGSPLASEVEESSGLSGDEQPGLLLLSDDEEAAGELTRLGRRAWGVLPVDASAGELAAAVRALAEGLLAGAPHLLQGLFSGRVRQAALHPSAGIDPLPEPLTPREAEVLQLLAQGLANKQIAVALKVSEHTVKFHVASIYTKLGVSNRTEAVRAGARGGLIVL